MLCAASAASLSAMGALMAAPPVGASPMRPLDPPGGCDSYTFPAGLTIKQGDGTNVLVNNGATAQLNGASASYTVGGKTTTGTASGGSTGGVNLTFDINWGSGPGNGSTNHYTGVVTKTGSAQGMSVSNKGPQTAWSSAPQTFGCVMNPAPVVSNNPVVPPPVVVPPAGPSINVVPDQKPDHMNFAVTNTSTEDLKCVYNAKKLSGLIGPPTTTQNFSLKAGASTTLKFLAIPVGTTYQVDISCQGSNGGAAYSHNFTG